MALLLLLATADQTLDNMQQTKKQTTKPKKNSRVLTLMFQMTEKQMSRSILSGYLSFVCCCELITAINKNTYLHGKNATLLKESCGPMQTENHQPLQLPVYHDANT